MPGLGGDVEVLIPWQHLPLLGWDVEVLILRQQLNSSFCRDVEVLIPRIQSSRHVKHLLAICWKNFLNVEVLIPRIQSSRHVKHLLAICWKNFLNVGADPENSKFKAREASPGYLLEEFLKRRSADPVAAAYYVPARARRSADPAKNIILHIHRR
ncbi:uncharacterized protein LOC135376389 isoform X1 [Ornithodoros turicata]|uniref:uncharacterized protein LOC135376389 isoform X1 n=1 Tax=Ornithodoros turicata TaxID=34597 RepID=UPI00313940B7